MLEDDDLPTFVRQNFRSVWALELLLLLRGTPGRHWSIDALVSEMRATTPLIVTSLGALERAGLIAGGSEGYRFAAASTLVEQLCGRLEAAYRERPVSVINLISAPADRLKELADAFRIKGGGR